MLQMSTLRGSLRTWLVGSLSLVAACSAEAPRGAVSGHLEPIVNGELAPDEDNVVLIYLNGGQFSGTCTGSIIADRVVLTAKHCVQLADAAGPVRPDQLFVGVGPKLTQSGTGMKFYTAVDVVTTPGSFGEDSLSLQTELVGVDVALITLRESPKVSPLPVKLTSPVEDKGTRATAIGYGQQPSGTTGVKMRVDTTVVNVLERTIQVTGTICQGDSGGPLINHEGKVIGVVSVGTAGSCGPDTPSFYNRIDLYGDMITEAVQKSGDCSNDGPEACDGFDNDCDQMVDEDCKADGETCSNNDQCTSRLCADTKEGKICTSRCDPLAPAVCAEGFVCQATSDCQGLCVPGDLGTKTFGERCETNDECETLFCDDPGDGKKRCLAACRGGEGGCFANEVCVAQDGQCGSCVDSDLVKSPVGQDEPCENDGDCRSGHCFDDGGVKYCVATCGGDEDCQGAHHCRDDVCVRGERGGQGSPCVATNDCASGLFCAKSEQGDFCTSTCTGNECIDGFSCKPVANGKACLPDLSTVGGACAGDEDCLSGFCFEQGKVCTRTCAAPSDCGPGLECVRSELGAPGICLPPSAVDLAPPDQPGTGGDGGSDGDDGSDGSTGAVKKDSGDCSVRPGAPVGAVPFALFGLLAVLRMRRRRA